MRLLVDQTCEPGRVVVADLGSAKRLADASGFTVTIGTPAYMAPEQLDGTSQFDVRADVYSLAVVTWELLTGTRLPHPVALGRRRTATRAPRRRLSTEVAGISRPVIDVLEMALDPDPNRRPRDARAFAMALVAADAAARPARRGWPATLVVAAALVVFVLAAALGWLVF
jgi:eukaryotic-like serine/threonine-protein kinase